MQGEKNGKCYKRLQGCKSYKVARVTKAMLFETYYNQLKPFETWKLICICAWKKDLYYYDISQYIF